MILGLSIFTYNCENQTESNHDNDSFYLNSFESPKDTVNWQGYGAISFRNDAPVNGGEQSLYVSGGCIVPHATVNLNNINNDSYLTIHCWGKNLVFGGTVELNYEDSNNQYHSISISVNDSTWTYYQSMDTLFCPANQVINLEINSGGFVHSAMLIDLLEVQIID